MNPHFRLATSLLLGLLTALALAWGVPCAMIASAGTGWDFFGWNPNITGPERFWADAGPPYPRSGFYRLKKDTLLDFAFMARVEYWDVMEQKDRSHSLPPPSWAATVSVDGREGFARVTTSMTGWPFRCFRGECWTNWRLSGSGLPAKRMFSSNQYHTRALVLVPVQGAVSSFGVPYQPLWPELLLNVAIFAFAWLLILLAIAATRRRLRRRRGHCPHCNYNLYDLTPDTNCPECGHTRNRP